MVPVAIQGNLIGRGAGGPQGVGASDGGVMYTLTKADVHGVVQPYAVGNTLTARMAKGINSTLDEGQTPVIALQDVRPVEKAQNGKGWNDDGSAYTVDTHATQGVAQPIGLDEEQNAMVDGFGTLKARTAGGGFEGSVMQTNMQVRRLTPVECERLQGFPDNYTNIPWRKKPEAPDGPRYKALGNSWAVPNVRWIGQRIADHLKTED